MQRRIIGYTLLIAIFAIALYSQNPTKPSVIIGDDTFYVKIANNDPERTQGLMGVSMLGKDEGMLFEFQDYKPRSFWMKNTLIPLDIIFINENNKIIKIHSNAKPCKTQTCPLYTSNNLPAKYVLEINAYQAQEKNIQLNDTIKIQK